MGRRKLKIQRLETIKARQAKFSKRKSGILKKAKELSVLCDVDVALLIFSPTDKPTLFVGLDKGLIDVLERLSKMPIEDREERRGYTMEVLKKIYTNTESGFDPMRMWEDPRNDALKFYEEQLKDLKERFAEKSKILRDWKNPDNVDDLAQINIMEDHLVATLNTIRNRKNQLAMELQNGGRGFQGNLGPQNGTFNPAGF